MDQFGGLVAGLLKGAVALVVRLSDGACHLGMFAYIFVRAISELAAEALLETTLEESHGSNLGICSYLQGWGFYL